MSGERCAECGHAYAPARNLMLSGCWCDCHVETGGAR